MTTDHDGAVPTNPAESKHSLNARERDVARGRVQVLKTGCWHMVDSIVFKRQDLEHLPDEVRARRDKVDAALDRVASALQDAIEELWSLDRDIAALDVREEDERA